MPDTKRAASDLLTNLFQDGQTGGISAQDMRDLIVSLLPAYGGLYFSTPAATTISVAGTFVKAAGTTTLTDTSSDVGDAGASNRLQYTGTPDRHFAINGQVSISPASGTGQDIAVSIWHYDDSGASGSLLAHSEAHTTIPATQETQISFGANVTLSADDYIEVHITNETGTVNLQVDHGYLFMRELAI